MRQTSRGRNEGEKILSQETCGVRHVRRPLRSCPAKSLTTILIAASLLAASAQTASAQTASTQTASTTSDVQSLAEVVVTAEKRSEALQNVPLTVAVVGPAQLSQAGVTNMKDLGDAIPGLQISQDGDFAVPAIRGITDSQVTPSSEPSVPIFLDGVYIPSRTAMLFDLPDVQQIQVLEGPQSMLAGQAAIGGAILITTRDPTSVPSGMLRADLGGYNGGSGSGGGTGFVSGPLAPDLSGSVSFGYHRDLGYVRNIFRNDWIGSDSEFVRSKLRWRPSEKLDVLASAWYSASNDPESIAYAPLPPCRTPYYASCVPTKPWQVALDYNGPAKSNTVGTSLRATYDLGEGVLTSTTGYMNNRFHGITEASGTPAVAAVTDARTLSTSVSQNLDFASKQRKFFSYIVGLSYLEDTDGYSPLTTHLPGDEPALFTVYDTLPMRTYGVYGEVNFNLTDRLTLIGGARYINENKQELGANAKLSAPGSSQTYGDHTYTYWAPRTSLRYKLTDRSDVYATYSTGFEVSPYTSTDSTGTIVNPETLKSYEIGYKVAAGRFALDVSAYIYNFSNYIAHSAYENIVTGVYVNQLKNAASAKAKGLDVHGSVYVTSEFLVSAGLSYEPQAEFGSFPNAVANLINPSGPGTLTNQTVNLTGARLPYAPKVTGNLTGRYTTQLSAGNLVTAVSVYHTSTDYYDIADQIPQPSYTLVNASVAFTPSEGELTGTVWVKNLTNAAYTNGYWPTAFFGRSWAPPREIGISLEKDW